MWLHPTDLNRMPRYDLIQRSGTKTSRYERLSSKKDNFISSNILITSFWGKKHISIFCLQLFFFLQIEKSKSLKQPNRVKNISSLNNWNNIDRNRCVFKIAKSFQNISDESRYLESLWHFGFNAFMMSKLSLANVQLFEVFFLLGDLKTLPTAYIVYCTCDHFVL